MTAELLLVFPIVIPGFKQKFQTSISWAPPETGPIQPQRSKITAITSKQEIQRNINFLYDMTIDSILNMSTNSNNGKKFASCPATLVNTKQTINYCL